jgi:outer membrane protein OmpA-like peptidoglycan-associated protein
LQLQYTSNILNLVNYLKKSPQTVLEIYGHTDMVGNDQTQVTLSDKRAIEVKNYFIKNGIDQNRLAVKGFGKSRPVWKNEDAAWKAHENRRIEVLLLY